MPRTVRFALLLSFLSLAACAKSRLVPEGDAGVDANDTAPHDAGFDASDASDAGFDASDGAPDAGPPECTPGSLDCSVFPPPKCSWGGHWVAQDPGALTVCGDVPANCAIQGFDCGFASDGLGGRIDCDEETGGCAAGFLCDANHCVPPGDVPATCADFGFECGMAGDGLGGTLDCDKDVGGCGPGFVCGSGAQANHCVPVP